MAKKLRGICTPCAEEWGETPTLDLPELSDQLEPKEILTLKCTKCHLVGITTSPLYPDRIIGIYKDPNTSAESYKMINLS